MQNWQKSCNPYVFQGTIVSMVCDYVMYFVELYETKVKVSCLTFININHIAENNETDVILQAKKCVKKYEAEI